MHKTWCPASTHDIHWGTEGHLCHWGGLRAGHTLGNSQGYGSMMSPSCFHLPWAFRDWAQWSSRGAVVHEDYSKQLYLFSSSLPPKQALPTLPQQTRQMTWWCKTCCWVRDTQIADTASIIDGSQPLVVAMDDAMICSWWWPLLSGGAVSSLILRTWIHPQWAEVALLLPQYHFLFRPVSSPHPFRQRTAWLSTHLIPCVRWVQEVERKDHF